MRDGSTFHTNTLNTVIFTLVNAKRGLMLTGGNERTEEGNLDFIVQFCGLDGDKMRHVVLWDTDAILLEQVLCP